MEYLFALVFGLGLAATFGLIGETSEDREPEEDGPSTEGPDLLQATGDETLEGLGGDDTLSGTGNAALFGGDGRDVLLTDETAEAQGGAGGDFLRADFNSTIRGGAGNDVLMANAWADAFGGAGDDTLVLDPFGAGINGEQMEATGGEGRDLFLLDDSSFLGGGLVVISDFDPATDRIALEGFGLGGSAVLQSVEAQPDPDAGHTDLLVSWFSPNSDPGLITSTIRLDGVTSFDPASVEIVTNAEVAGDGFSAALGAPGVFVPGTSGADSVAGAGAAILQTGDGDDVVTTAASGFVAGDLGAGDDSLTATGAETRVYGGAGDDSYTLDLDPGTLGQTGLLPGGDITEIAAFDGGAGNDDIRVLGTGAGTAPTILAGGAGDDVMTASPGTEGVVFYGGEGADTITAHTGATVYGGFTNSPADPSDRISLTIDSDALDPADLTVVGGMTGAGPGSVTVTIDPRLTGPLSVVNQIGVIDSGIGPQILFSTVFVGDTPILLIDEPQVDLDAGFQLDDPRFVFQR